MDRLAGLRFCAIYISSVYAVHSLASADQQSPRDPWVTGYKIFFVVAAAKSALSGAHLRLFSWSEQAEKLQYATLATTANGEELALSREDRFSKAVSSDTRRASRDCHSKKRADIAPCDRFDPVPVFWPSFAIALLLYNTIHLALSPMSHVAPLLFGAPAFVGYWGVVRLVDILLR